MPGMPRCLFLGFSSLSIFFGLNVFIKHIFFVHLQICKNKTNMVSNGVILLVVIVAFLAFLKFVYPVDKMGVGKKISVYLDGIFNRTATVSRNLARTIVIYDTLSLPVHYRGKFYAIGHTDDGHKLMFVTKRRFYFFACIAELIRKVVGTPEYQDPTIERETGNDINPMTEDAEDEQ